MRLTLAAAGQAAQKLQLGTAAQAATLERLDPQRVQAQLQAAGKLAEVELVATVDALETVGKADPEPQLAAAAPQLAAARAQREAAVRAHNNPAKPA